MPRMSVFLGVWIPFLAFLTFCPLSGSAQTIHGVVVDSLTAEPLGEAWVTFSGTGGTVAAITGPDGRFELRVEGESPLDLTVQRAGYLERTLQLGADDVQRELRIGLAVAPFGVEGLEVEAERLGPDFRFMGQFVTDSGLVWPGRPELRCTFVMIDSVVVKDYDLLRPEVVENYDQAHQWRFPSGRGGSFHAVMRQSIDDPRVLRDAWPCGVLIPYPDHPSSSRRRPPKPPEPEGRPMGLLEHTSHLLSALPSCPGSLAVSRKGNVALLAGGGSMVQILGPDGELQRSLDMDIPRGAEPCALRVGWRGDTLWVTDGSRTRLSSYAPEGPPAIMEGVGLPESNAWNSSERTLPSSPLEMDLPVPVPVAGDRFLWTYPAPDPPTPPIHPDDPPGRMLVVLDDEWKLNLVLEALRPGAAAVDVVLGSSPVLGDQPFGDHPLYRISPDGSHLTLVRREHQMASWMTAYRVTRVTMDGDTLFHVERRASMVPTDEETFEAAAAELAALPGAVEAFPGPTQGRQALIRGMLNRPPFHPPISDLLVGFDGTTWLRWPDTRKGDVRWEVLDSRGEPLWTFEADRRLELVAAHGEEVWGLMPDEEGGKHLIRFTLAPLEGG